MGKDLNPELKEKYFIITFGNKFRIQQFILDLDKELNEVEVPDEINEEEYIKLLKIGEEGIFRFFLIYHIKLSQYLGLKNAYFHQYNLYIYMILPSYK